MRLLIKLVITCAVLGIAIWLGIGPTKQYLFERNRPKWETAPVLRGDAKRVINSTGKLQPVLEVSVGAFVSGQILELTADFNDEVKQGDILAKVDPRNYQATVDRDQALLTTQKADVRRTQAQLEQARTKLARGESLRKKNETYLSQEELDALMFECKALEAQLEIAHSSVIQAEANLNNSKTNLAFTEIRSPVDGFILDRKIGPGQMLASQFQTPELFKLAPDLREKMHVYASVDEADIGLIRHAFELQLPVTFSIDAYPNELFHGVIEQVRYSANEVQNVITYPVLVAASNPELKLLPKMTANVSFEVDSRSNVLKVPNAALRFYPEQIEYVRPEDRKLLDGSQWAVQSNRSNAAAQPSQDTKLSAAEQTESLKDSNRRHVWIVENGLLRAVEVMISFAESRFTIIESGELTDEMQLVVGIEKPKLGA
jgi:HlyD family secretion protein